jgi:superoxide dismutase, Fe-Mn family
MLYLLFILNPVLSADCSAKLSFLESSSTYPFSLSPLPYSYNFLEPFLTSTILYAHHDHHHQSYVDKLNSYLSQQSQLQSSTLFELNLAATSDSTLQKHAGGFYNHNMYWFILTSPECAKSGPQGELLDKINDQWGGLSEFQTEFLSQMNSVFGSGWVWACVNAGGDIEVRTTANQINPLMGVSGNVCYPFMGIDLWEHSYYLLYMWDRASYVTASWDALDWEMIEVFYELYASQQEPVPF